jgi:hypothetical protein
MSVSSLAMLAVFSVAAIVLSILASRRLRPTHLILVSLAFAIATVALGFVVIRLGYETSQAEQGTDGEMYGAMVTAILVVFAWLISCFSGVCAIILGRSGARNAVLANQRAWAKVGIILGWSPAVVALGLVVFLS